MVLIRAAYISKRCRRADSRAMSQRKHARKSCKIDGDNRRKKLARKLASVVAGMCWGGSGFRWFLSEKALAFRMQIGWGFRCGRWHRRGRPHGGILALRSRLRARHSSQPDWLPVSRQWHRHCSQSPKMYLDAVGIAFHSHPPTWSLCTALRSNESVPLGVEELVSCQGQPATNSAIRVRSCSQSLLNILPRPSCDWNDVLLTHGVCTGKQKA